MIGKRVCLFDALRVRPGRIGSAGKRAEDLQRAAHVAFKCLSCVVVDVRFALRAVTEARRAAHAAAFARHALDKVRVKPAVSGLEQGYAALFEAVAYLCFDLFSAAAFVYDVFERRGHSARARKNTAVIRGVVELAVRQALDIYIKPVEKRLQLLEGYHAVDGAAGLFEPEL